MILNHQRRLQKLQEQRALEGIHVNPAVLIEIEDIQAELKSLRAELKTVERKPRRSSRGGLFAATASRVELRFQRSLNPKQKEILAFIKKFNQEKGLSPTIEEIRVALNLSSKSLVHYHLKGLEKAGLIARLPNKSRGIRLL
jgi:predicted transcriptional regulator